MIKKLGVHKRRIRQILSVALAAVLIGSVSFLGVRYYNSSNAATAKTFYVSPASGELTPGSNTSITIREDSGTTPVNSAQVFVTYNPNQLQYLNHAEGGSFDVETFTDTSQSGLVRLHRGMDKATLTGNHAVITLNFKVLASSGNTTIGIDKANSFLGDGTKDVLESVTGATYSIRQSVAKDATFSFSPNSGTLAKDATLNVAVRLNSPTQKVYVAQPIISYPADKLQYVGVTNSNVFSAPTRTNNTAGTLDIMRGVKLGSGGFTGSDVVVTVTFKVIGSSGSIPLSIKSGSGVYDYDGKNNILGNSSAANYTIAQETVVAPPDNNPQPPAGGGGNTGGGGSTGGSGNTGGGGGSSSGGSSKSAPVYRGTVTYRPQAGSTASVSGDSTELQGSVALTPLQNQTEGDSITKVEYFIGKKLVATKTESPFTYDFDTRKLQNGKYDITIKTTYSSGTIDTTKDTISVKNPVTLSYVFTHYGLAIFVTILSLAIAAAILWKYVRPRFLQHENAMAYSGYEGYVGDASSNTYQQYADPHVAPGPQVIAPTSGSVDNSYVAPEQAAATQSTEPLNMQDVQTYQPVSPQQQAPAPQPQAPAPQSGNPPQQNAITPTQDITPPQNQAPRTDYTQPAPRNDQFPPDRRI